MVNVLKIGSKGELFLLKKIQEEMKFKPGDRIFVEINNKNLILRKIVDLEDLLLDPPLTESQIPQDIEEEIHQIQKERIRKTLKEK